MMFKESIIWNFIKIFWNNKIIISSSVVSITLLTFITTSLMDKTYFGTLTFVITEEEGGLNLSSILGDLPFDLGGGGTDVDKYIAYLSSRRIQDVIIKKFDLWNIYEAEYIEQVYKALSKNVEILDNMDGTVTIRCYYKNEPEKAAEMTQLYYDELYKLVLSVNQQKARGFNSYMADNYKNTLASLTLLEDSMKAFQIENNIVEMESQIKFSFEVLATLIEEKYAYKIQRDILKSQVASNSKILNELNIKLKTIEHNINNIFKEGDGYILAMDKVPTKGLEYFRLYRGIEIQHKILEIILPMYENSKMEIYKQSANIQVLDKPYIPQYKVRPKRLSYMLIFAFLIFTFEMTFFALKKFYTENKKDIHVWINE